MEVERAMTAQHAQVKKSAASERAHWRALTYALSVNGANLYHLAPSGA
eukprot:SAG11_NODE_691_length_7699_cov_3.868026_10_plen_48_part_00